MHSHTVGFVMYTVTVHSCRPGQEARVNAHNILDTVKATYQKNNSVERGVMHATAKVKVKGFGNKHSEGPDVNSVNLASKELTINIRTSEKLL